MAKVAAIILNFNMAEMTDALVARFKEVTRYPHDLYVIDNGSTQDQIAKSTTHRLEHNGRLVGGFNFGMDCVREHQRAVLSGGGEAYDAVWFICNDIKFQGSTDVLAVCMHHHRMAKANRKPLGVIHPALARGPGVWNWPHMYANPRGGIHNAWFVDIVCPIYSRELLDVLKWKFNPDLIYGWGIDVYTCFESWESNLPVVVCSDVEVWHKMGTTYQAGKDPEFANFDAYKAAAGGKQHEVLNPFYGQLATERGYKGDYMKMFQDAPEKYLARLPR